MKRATLKDFMKWMLVSSKRNKYEIKFTGKDSQDDYLFTVNDGRLIMDSTRDSVTVSMEISSVEGIDDIQTEDIVFPYEMVEHLYRRDGSEYERNITFVHYEAQMFLKLFRILGENLVFKIQSGDMYKTCYFLGGRVLYIEENETEYKVVETDMFKIQNTFPGFKILYLSPLPTKTAFMKFIKTQENIAYQLGKTFINTKSGMRVGRRDFKK